MMVYSGFDNDGFLLDDLYLLNLERRYWHKAKIINNNNSSVANVYRFGQSCVWFKDFCVLFGGKSVKEEFSNNLYFIYFHEDNSDCKLSASINLKECVSGHKMPEERAYHSASVVGNFMVVIGGVNSTRDLKFDVWLYDLLGNVWYEAVVDSHEVPFIDRLFSHCAVSYDNSIYLIGGMKDNFENIEGVTIISLLENGNGNDDNNIMKQDDVLVVANNSSNYQMTTSKDEAIDTKELNNDDDDISFEKYNKEAINKLISWSFLSKLSEYYQWPLLCLSNFVDNSMKDDVGASSLDINVFHFDKFIYSQQNLEGKAKYEENPLKDGLDFSKKILVLTIKDNGKGIPVKEFNEIFYNFSKNENNEMNFFKYGLSIKASAIRLANSFLIITKTESTLSIGLISKNLQSSLNVDFIMTPIVHFKVDCNENTMKTSYIPMSNYSHQTLNLILNEVKFMFYSSDIFFAYLDKFKQGTHFFLYNLKQLSNNPSKINQLTNYELLFDYNNFDILFNSFEKQIGERNFVDSSFRIYLNLLYLNKRKTEMNLTLFGKRVNMDNLILSMLNSIEPKDVQTISFNKGDVKENQNAVVLDGDIYKGFIYNSKFVNQLKESALFFNKEDSIFNGILLYYENRLVCRFEQNKLGDIYYFVKKFEKSKENEPILPISGFVEMPSGFHQLLSNKAEFKEQTFFAIFYSKLRKILKKLKN